MARKEWVKTTDEAKVHWDCKVDWEEEEEEVSNPSNWCVIIIIIIIITIIEKLVVTRI
jgi:hypothetical protein